MKQYVIKVPRLNQFIDQDYANIEVFEMVDEPTFGTFESVGVHIYKDGLWSFSKSQIAGTRLMDSPINKDIVFRSNRRTEIFEDLEIARASKFFLLKNVQNEYMKLFYLHTNPSTIRKRNIPDVSKEIQEYKNTYPEQFI